MKKYMILLVFISGILASCNDLLDLQTDGRITIDEIFKDRNGVRGYLNSCYGSCPGPYMDRASYTDEAQDADDISPNSRYGVWYSDGVTAQSFANYSVDGSPWTSLYTGIRRCNVFLQNIVNVTSNTILATDNEIAGWTAQAHTLRALYYLQLIKRYGAVPLLTEDYGITHDYKADRRSTFAEVVRQIIEDCDAALAAPNATDGFPWSISDNQNGIMHRAIPYAIKSQAITYAASPYWSDGTYTWADATEINKDALYQCLTNDYKLFDVTPAADIAQNAYALYFFTNSYDKRAVDKETIYQCGGQMEVWKYAGLPSTPGMVKSGPCPTQELVDSYEMAATGEPPVTGYADEQHLNPVINQASGYNPDKPYEGRDPRFYASIYYNGAVRNLDNPDGQKVEAFAGGTDGITETNSRTTRTGYYQRKFNNWKSNVNNNADGAVRLFRLAELYLNFAESAYQSNSPDELISLGPGITLSARDAVNAVRRRAGMPDFKTGMTKEEFEKKYRNERRVELAFEEHRYFDVRRWNILDQTDRCVSGMRITNSGGNDIYTRISFGRKCWSSKYMLYAIDQDEVDKMGDYTGENWQNPGWN